MKTVAYIFARGGSKGVPRKNLRTLQGESLLSRAISTARASKFINKVVVSTDDWEIAEHAKNCGAIVPFIRPDYLASDEAKEWTAWQHAAKYMIGEKQANENTVFVSVPTTTPFKTYHHINQCIETFYDSDFDIVLTGYESNHHPSFNMVKHRRDGAVELISPPENAVAGRQAVPYRAYNLTTICYVTSHRYVLEENRIFDKRVGLVEVDQWSALDIDTEYDLKLSEALMKNFA